MSTNNFITKFLPSPVTDRGQGEGGQEGQGQQVCFTRT